VRKILAGLLGAGLALSLTACGSDEIPADSVYANQGALIGISMPNKTSTRWLGDGQAMTEQFQAMGYKVDLQYGEDTVELQNQQVRDMIKKNARLLVISAFDGEAMNDVLAEAAAKGVQVIAYDRLLIGTNDVNFQATFDNERVGRMQAQLIEEKLNLAGPGKEPHTIELFAGSPTDINARYFYDGAMDILKPYLSSGELVIRSKQRKFDDITTEAYSGEVAGQRMSEILAADYKDEPVDAVLSPYDGMTIGIIKALKADGYAKNSSDKPLPITSGQDAELPSVQSIMNDEQTGTIFKDTRELAKAAVEQGNALLTGTAPITNATVTNDAKNVPTYYLYPVAVEKSNYKTLLVDSGYYTEEQLAEEQA
jgi:putative multiple sugar transport system substrate-binding protein